MHESAAAGGTLTGPETIDAREDERPEAEGPGGAAERLEPPAQDPAPKAEDPSPAPEPEPQAQPEPAAAAASEEEADPGPGPGDRLDDDELVRGVSALVFASPEPIPLRRIVQLLDGPRPGRVRSALTEIARRLDEAGLPLELREIAGGWHFMTAPETYETVAKLSKTRRSERLSAAGLETLAVVAYRQPVTKAEIEAIRGVQCGAMLRTLVDRGLARVTGRASQPGSPLQYGTTRAFLDRFGLASLQDLPRDGELLGE